jgi:hypothetical protein
MVVKFDNPNVGVWNCEHISPYNGLFLELCKIQGDISTEVCRFGLWDYVSTIFDFKKITFQEELFIRKWKFSGYIIWKLLCILC